MKKFMLLSAILFVSMSMFAQTEKTEEKVVDPNAAVMTVENETIDYGEAVRGEDDGIRVFKFTNTGKSPLKLVNVKSSCGCTVPSYSKVDIMPGESGEITVKYNMRPGRFSKSITVTTNGNPERVVLRIKGNIVDPNAAAPIQKPQSMMSNQ